MLLSTYHVFPQEMFFFFIASTPSFIEVSNNNNWKILIIYIF